MLPLVLLTLCFYSSIFSSWNRTGYASRISLSSSQVASFGLSFFHCTLTWLMVWFRSKVFLLSRIRSSPTWNSPSGSTWITFQSITWVASWIYLFKIETWKTLCTLIVGGRANWYATSPTLAKISNCPQYLDANFGNHSMRKYSLCGFIWRHKWIMACILLYVD